MRKNHQHQPSLPPTGIDHSRAKELEKLSELLDSEPAIAALAAQDLVPDGVAQDRGRPGMSGDQVLRAALVRQIFGCSFEILAFHLADSLTLQRFCRIGLGERPPKKSTLASNIKRLQPETIEAIHRIVLKMAADRGIERGRKARIDCTVVDSLIHHPTDSSLLVDTVRVVARLVKRAMKYCPTIAFSNRTRSARSRGLEILNAKNEAARRPAYKSLVSATIQTLDFAEKSLPKLEAFSARNRGLEGPEARHIMLELKHYSELGWKVVDQTVRRVLQKEKVPSPEKISSIFEEHTDIIVKSRRETLFGHKICLSTGASSMTLDMVVLDGNPNDATLVDRMLDRHRVIFDSVPRQIAFDGGFTSRSNLEFLKEQGVKDVCFHKKRGLEVAEMTQSPRTYKKLRRFRAGVEGCISFLKRSFGMGRCRWRSLRSFRSYVWMAVLACNLLRLSRRILDG